MRLANVDGRAVLLTSDTTGVDVADLSDGRFGPEPGSVLEQWDDFREWANGADTAEAEQISFDRGLVGSPSPTPRQIVAIGLNYIDHAKESGLDVPTGLPPTFTKFVSALTGPDTTVTLPPDGATDWEVELVAVIGREAKNVSEDEAWDHVAGLTIGQDLSERKSQLAGPAPQFSLGKSFPGFAPVGPWLVTVDEVDSAGDKDDLALGCLVNGVTMQDGRTSNLIQSVPRLIAALSCTITLHPGDLLFTGTPAGVGAGRKPPRFLADGDQLRSWIEGLGEQHQTFVAG
ncbi:fumarylacetoacetate hydrolase family protein [Knoellia sp. CPCC 206453]|uniref:fumarylacetoacetate hydrolase family protein n=1 Tax=Knoellia pratensis TaxID=3404796 RepID=UPI0036104555